jgi:DNA repair protein SbcD/Mre11
VRLLHTSDWHLGRTTHGRSRAPDHDRAIAEILDAARDARPHLILHTGDLFDASRPGYEEMTRGIDALRRLAELAPVLVLCGNHDSPALFRVFARLHGEDGRIGFAAEPRPAPWRYPGDEGEEIRVAALPFVHQNRAIRQFEHDPADWAAAYLDRIARAWGHLNVGLAQGLDAERHVLVTAAHLHLAGARLAGSERLVHFSDGYAAQPEHLPHASYTALGHIHRPQEIPGGAAGRYAGSPIPLDFGEEGEAKGAVLVEARPGRPARIETIPLSGGRPLLTLTGSLDDLPRRAEDARGALVRVRVLTAQPTPELARRVADLLPGADLLEVVEECAGVRLRALDPVDGPEPPERGIDDLFVDYLSAVGVRGAAADRVLGGFRALLAAVEDEEAAPRFPALDALADDEAAALAQGAPPAPAEAA